MSRGSVGAVGNVVASSAQSKCAGAVRHSGLGLERHLARDRRLKTVAAGVGDPSSAVKDVRRGETARLWLNWGELGRIGRERGCFEGSGSVRRHSRGVARGSGWRGAGG